MSGHRYQQLAASPVERQCRKGQDECGLPNGIASMMRDGKVTV
jgi:hypothetical protein